IRVELLPDPLFLLRDHWVGLNVEGREWCRKRHAHNSEFVEVMKAIPFSRTGIPKLYQNLRRTLNQVYRGVSRRDYQKYLNEACFRYNTSITDKSLLTEMYRVCLAAV